MKKLLLAVCIFIAAFSFSQVKEAIKFKGNISNYNGNIYKSLTVLDQREDKMIGIIPFGNQKEMREVVFPTNPGNDLGMWYTKSNYEGGRSELVLVLKKLKLSTGETIDKNTEGTIDFSAQTFLKDGDKYRFIYKKDTVFAFNHKEVSELMIKNIPTIFSIFIKKTYSLSPIGSEVTLNELADYESYTKSNYEVFKNEQLKDGIYLDYISFFTQNPQQGYTFERNDKGEMTKAIKEENGKKNKISASKMFVYVENGKAYKKTMSGFMELNRNEKGFYLLTNRGYLFPAQYNSTYGMFGLIGGIAGAIDQSSKQKKMKKEDIVEVYIDPLTGEYDFPADS